MHFSIPETKEITDPVKRTQYTVFHIHCNGVFHCAVRYSQFFNFNLEVQKTFKAPLCAMFPPKRMLTLSVEQLNQRRIQLESYFQQLSQDPAISSSPTFTDFLLHAQEEVKQFCEEVEITVYLVNRKSVTLAILSSDQTDQVLEDVCNEIGIEEDMTYYFGLFLVRENGKRFTIVRPLQDFECPYISLERTDNPEYKIQIRKAYWDPVFDENLVESSVASNLVYLQAVEDVKLKHLDYNEDHKTQLAALKEEGDKEGFVRLCNEIPGYCFYRWKDVVCDYPEKDTEAMVSIGAYALRIREANGEDSSFSVTRMRCWKISSDKPSTTNDEVLPYDEEGADSPLTLSFDYLVAKDELKWVTLRSSNAIVMSMILQLVVDELVRKKRGEPLRKPSDRERKPRPQLRRRPPPAPKPDPEDEVAEDGSAGEAEAAPALKVVVKSKKKKKEAPSGADLAQDIAASAFASDNSAFGDADHVKNDRVFGAMGDDDL